LQRTCVLDIDGILNTYPDCWVDFINKNRPAKGFSDLNQAKCNLSYLEYKNLKHLYRASGYKRTLPIREGAAEFTEKLRAAGYIIALVTSRPFDEYPTLREQTNAWLNNGGFKYDDLICSRHKHADIIVYYPKMCFMVEDNRAFANSIASLGYRVYLLNNRYNQGIINRGVERIDFLREIEYMEGIQNIK
jgi:uncharacterized HAD superfamily protein